MPVKNYESSRVLLTWGPQWSLGYTLTNWIFNPFNQREIFRMNPLALWGGSAPDLSGALVIGLSGAGVGQRFHIRRSGATGPPALDFILFEEDLTGLFLNTDRWAIFPKEMSIGDLEDWEAVDGQHLPAGNLYAYWREYDQLLGHVDDSELPDWKQDVDSIYAHISDTVPQPAEGSSERWQSIAKNKIAEAVIPIAVSNPRILFFGMGWVNEEGTAAGAASTVLNDTYPGEWQVTLAIAGGLGFNVGDFVRVGDPTSGVFTREGGEIRQVTAKNVDVLHLDRPLRRFHNTGVGVVEVVAPFTHEMRSTRQLSPWPIYICAQFNGNDWYSGRDDMRVCYAGTHITKMDFKGDTDEPLIVELKVTSLNQYTKSGEAVVEADDADYSEFPYHWGDASVEINGVVYRQVESFSGHLETSRKMQRYSTRQGGIKPHEFIGGRRKAQVDVVVPYHNEGVIDLITDSTEFGLEVVYERGTNDSMGVRWIGCKALEAKRSAPRTPHIPVELRTSAQGMRITVTDDIPYY